MERPLTATPKTERAASPRLLAAADLGATKAKILEAAFRRLAGDGYAALSVREIAKDAGVNHALINYHFRSKDQLVIEVLDAANRRLLVRQNYEYTDTRPVLRVDREGRILIGGGARRGSSNDLPPPSEASSTNHVETSKP